MFFAEQDAGSFNQALLRSNMAVNLDTFLYQIKVCAENQSTLGNIQSGAAAV
jgi:hypothetical protein